MNITDYIKKLRTAANALEDLLDSNPSSNAKAGRGILKGINKWKEGLLIGKEFEIPMKKEEEVGEVFRQGFNELAVKKEKRTAKGFKYPKGTHWTQKPEYKNKLAKVVRQMTKTNKAIYAKTKAD